MPDFNRQKTEPLDELLDELPSEPDARARGMRHSVAMSITDGSANTVTTWGLMKARTSRDDLEEDTLPDAPPPGWAQP